jgi:hypothetical protein
MLKHAMAQWENDIEKQTIKQFIRIASRALYIRLKVVALKSTIPLSENFK